MFTNAGTHTRRIICRTLDFENSIRFHVHRAPSTLPFMWIVISNYPTVKQKPFSHRVLLTPAVIAVADATVICHIPTSTATNHTAQWHIISKSGRDYNNTDWKCQTRANIKYLCTTAHRGETQKRHNSKTTFLTENIASYDIPCVCVCVLANIG